MKEITIIGMGPGAAGYLTEEGKAAIEQAEVLIGSERLIKQYPNKSIAAVTAKQVAAVIEDKEAKRFAVLMSGDTGFYSGTKKLIPLLRADIVTGFCREFLPLYIWRLRLELHGRQRSLSVCMGRSRPIFR